MPFIPDDIPNGTYVAIVDLPVMLKNFWRDDKVIAVAHIFWHDGKIVDEEGLEVDLDMLLETKN